MLIMILMISIFLRVFLCLFDYDSQNRNTKKLKPIVVLQNKENNEP
jgi:hypothetical protein